MLDCNAQQHIAIRHNDIHRRIITTSKSGGEEDLQGWKKKRTKGPLVNEKGELSIHSSFD
jgi:hypothetical protein